MGCLVFFSSDVWYMRKKWDRGKSKTSLRKKRPRKSLTGSWRRHWPTPRMKISCLSSRMCFVRIFLRYLKYFWLFLYFIFSLSQISDGQEYIRKLLKYNTSITVTNMKELEGVRDIGEQHLEHNEKMMILQDKMVSGLMLDKICLDYYLPFSNNEEILEFLKKDTDFHRRNIALRDVC